MRPWLATAIGVGAVVIAAGGGYWAGFREGWEMGVRADAAPRGAIAIFQLEAIDAGRIDRVKPGLNHDIDMGLIHWHDLSNSQVGPMINILSGTGVVPEYEQYVRRLAAYRKSHQSPLLDPEAERTLLEGAAKMGPEYAREMKEGGDSARRALDAMIKRYGN